MEVSCSFKRRIGGACGFDSKDKKQSTVVVPLQSCEKDISSHRSVFQFTGVENEVDLILSRAAVFTVPEDVKSWTIFPLHRSKLGVGWSRRSDARCRMPQALSNHSKFKGPRAERGISKEDSKFILKKTGIFLQVGSGKDCTDVYNELVLLT